MSLTCKEAIYKNEACTVCQAHIWNVRCSRYTMSGTNVGCKCRVQMSGTNVRCDYKKYISNTCSLIEEFTSDVQNFLKQQKALTSAQRTAQRTAQTEGQPLTSEQTAQPTQPQPQLTSEQIHGKSYSII